MLWQDESRDTEARRKDREGHVEADRQGVERSPRDFRHFARQTSSFSPSQPLDEAQTRSGWRNVPDSSRFASRKVANDNSILAKRKNPDLENF